MIREALLSLYLQVVDVDLNGGRWYQQLRYRPKQIVGPFGRGGPEHIADMLAGEYWIVHEPPIDHPTRWLRFDFDADSHGIAQRNERYRRLRRIMGEHREPVVYGTPSGYGIRVAYPIAPTPIGELGQGQKHGLVPEVLRAAGIEPELGEIEIFPRPGQGDRLPLGRRMPFLDPETLQPLLGFDWSHEALSQATIERGLNLLERAASDPYPGLITHLRARDRKPFKTVADSPDDPDAANALFVQQPSGRLVMSERLEKIFEDGLPGPSSRYKTEWLMAILAHQDPERFKPYGLTHLGNPVEIASAVAEWLAHHHNGWSTEWNQEARRGESAAKEAFVHRYLKPNRKGITMIDRARAEAFGFGPRDIPTLHMAQIDRERLLQIVEKAIPRGAQRLKAEVWCAAFIWQYHSYRLANRARSQSRTDGQEMDARRMEELPYGQGKSKVTGQKRYVMYRSMLESEGWVRVVSSYLNVPGDGGRARTYRLDGLTHSTRRDLVFDGVFYPQEAIEAVLHGVPAPPNRDAATIHDAYHDLFLVSQRDMDLLSRYGRRTAQRVRSRADAVRELLT